LLCPRTFIFNLLRFVVPLCCKRWLFAARTRHAADCPDKDQQLAPHGGDDLSLIISGRQEF